LMVTVTWDCTDPGTDSWTFTLNWGDGTATSAPASVTCDGTDQTATHTYADDNPTATASDVNTITLTVNDDDTGTGTDTATVRVSNVAPVLGVLSVTESDGTANDGVVAKNVPITVTGSFTDVGTADTHTCTVDWDADDAAPPVAAVPGVTESGGSGSCSATTTYGAPGVYKVLVTVKDDDTRADTEEYRYIVVYDPNAGFVTGGGWINSPIGACSFLVCTTSPTGKANFGFVSKYQNGAKPPVGETEFQFKAGSLNFHSSFYTVLVISGCKAQYKGSGTINGSGVYDFVVTAYDGQAGGSGGCASDVPGDRFRIKIKNSLTNGGAVVYDNVGGADEIDGVFTGDKGILGGGSIVIHKK
jgi:hypothetical protein